MNKNDNKKSGTHINSDYGHYSTDTEERLDTIYSSEDLSSRICMRQLKIDKRDRNKIPYFVPHKQLLKKIEHKHEKIEPLSGFSDHQNAIIQKLRKVYTPVTKELHQARSLLEKNKLQPRKPIKIQVEPRSSLIKKDKMQSETRHKPTIMDQFDLIKRLQEDPSERFYYMIYAVDQSSEYFSPYALKIVDYKDVKKVYMTISANGVMQYSPDEMIFTPIELWEKEYTYYLKLMKLRLFATFRLWKSFHIWRKSISRRKFNEARNHMQENLFVSNPFLGKTLLQFKSMCMIFLNSSMVDISVIEKLPLFDFVELQLTKLEHIRNKLDKFREQISDIVYNACLAVLLRAGFLPNDANVEQIGDEKLGNPGQHDTGQFKMRKHGYKINYIEQARKREKCHRLSRFIHLIDYMQSNMMYGLLLNTYREFLGVLETHTAFIPEDTLLSSSVTNVMLKERRSASHVIRHPYFTVDLLISVTTGIVIDPSQDIFRFVIQTLQTMWEENLGAIKPLLSDLTFRFTRPTTNRKVEDRLSRGLPEILKVLKKDPTIQALKSKLFDVLETNFVAVKRYCQRFGEIERFYYEDMQFDENIIRANEQYDLFQAWCNRYKEEMNTIDVVVDYQPLGIFIIQLARFKKATLDAPIGKRNIMEAVMLKICRSRVNSLLKETIETADYLASEPVSTDDYVAYIKFVDKTQHRVDVLEGQLDYVKEIYDMMEEYDMTIPAEDFANYLGISAQFTTLRLAIEKVLTEKQQLIAKFDTQLQKDITALIDKLSEINDEVVQPWLLDVESNPEICLETLEDLNKRLVDCVVTAEDYKSYQKTFKMEVSKFEILDAVMNELRLRVLLWETVTTWEKIVDEWHHVDFDILNVDDVTSLTMRTLRNVGQLEKGLPINQVTPMLKENVNLMKNKLPVISYLKNPNLKQRHWLKIEGLLGYRFRPEDIVTLNVLENLNVFLYPNELMEISAAASSEANLESMLNKMEEVWKNLEFVIVPYKEAKDMFILGSLEEVLTALDESNICVQTVIVSRHVGPIKPRVEEWSKQLDLFAQTLEAWQYCQQQWMYFEAIFSTPDIQRQLPIEAKLFTRVDKSFKDLMRRTAKMPLAMTACTQIGLLEQLMENNRNLDEILKCLEAYLETKRIAFPRFFFLSNDELLEILAQTKNPLAVQRHLQKCFDAIYRLEFATMEKEEETKKIKEVVISMDITAMISPEGEKVALGKGLKARGNVEDWLSKVEESMFMSLRKRMKTAISDLELRKREQFLSAHPSQIVLTVSQIFWARDVHLILESGVNIQNSMQSFEQKCYSNLNQLAAMVREELPKLIRDVIVNLIIIDVHARDVITLLVQKSVDSSSSFDWLKTLRYYWDDEIDNCLARMSNAEYLYGYEYLGAQKRLVITPLTDKCYLCLMGALQLDLGGAPAGPAGTGKTETTKDLAKALAVQCVVFNCSEGLDYKMMGRFFSGLAMSGAWCCFDEFNRIDVEVLSVIAQQLITIRNAKLNKAKEFMFEGRIIKLVMSCAAFITMNPGYAGRTELPDNLKALFRPFAMMVPDYKLIAEVILYSEGFESSKILSKKMTLLYTLSSEQLSQQDHYDFGMRAVKSVLVMAGSLKRDNPDTLEEVILMRALRDSNIPKFLSTDTELFEGIVSDLFPDLKIPAIDYGIFEETAVTILQEAGLQPEPYIIKKTIQLHETMMVRHGIMLVGPTGGGKTTVLQTLSDTYTRLYDIKVREAFCQKVLMYVINPKAVTIGELYGEVDLFTNEWRDGLLGSIIRRAALFVTEEHQWIVCDGPVDAVWIENMNTVLDDNKMLCLSNSERIKFTPYMRMVFEVMDLAQASPATVSRCGMVYVDPAELQWLPYVRTWVQRLSNEIVDDTSRKIILNLFETYFDVTLTFFKMNCEHAIAQVDIGKANTTCAMMQAVLSELSTIGKIFDQIRMLTFLTQTFIFCLLWSVGGNAVDTSQELIEIYIKELFDENPDAHLPMANLWDLYVNVRDRRFDLWAKLTPPFTYQKETPFFDILVPTVDTTRFGYMMQKLVQTNKPVLFTGATGVGKSVITKVVLNSLRATELWVPITLIFSAQTTSGRTQEILELKLEKKKRSNIGAPLGKRVCVFVDDINMPKLDTYGSQPPIELLRQILDFGGMYDRRKLFWKNIEDVVFTAACTPPGGERKSLTPRFLRHFAMLLIPSPTETSLKTIFKAILRGFLEEFVGSIAVIGDKIVDAAVDVYRKIAVELLPTPEKSHYVFNLRDLSKCMQGIMQANSTVMREPKMMLRLFYHECLRVFYDRLVNMEDRSYFYRLLTSTCVNTFGKEIMPLPNQEIIEKPPLLLYGDFLKYGAPRKDRFYEEITDFSKIKSVLQDYLEDYCFTTNKEMKIIFFMDAIEHICRLARILRSERSNGLLVGVSGTGKQSLTKLASHLNGYSCHQIEITCTYDMNSWHEDLRRFYFEPGANAEHTTFLIADTQIVIESFLEDINNTLNTGEVPNLYNADELEKAIIATRPAAKSVGINESNREAIFQFFIDRVRNYLHLMICMSPIGDDFRRRCRMFPSLVNCCTIDWFSRWPDEALFSVAETSIAHIVPDSQKLSTLSSICVLMHQSVEEVTDRFFNEMRRRYYTTPSNYLELLKLFRITFDKRKTEILNEKNKILNGLNKLHETNELVVVMKEQLIILAPKLKASAVEVSQLMKVLKKQQVECDAIRNIVSIDQAAVKVKADETMLLEAEAREDLMAALPALEEAQKALEALNKNDINEIRVFNKPPYLVRFVMEAVNLLLGEKTDWLTAKMVLGDIHFLDRLLTYPKDEISDKLLKKLQDYVTHPDFQPELVAKQSKVCKSICIWVKAIDQYAKVFRVVEPKRQRLRVAQEELRAVEDVLALKQQQLTDVQDKMIQLETQYNIAMNNLQNFEYQMDLAENRLNRSGRLMSALEDEEVRWKHLTEEFDERISSLIGDALVAAGALAYLGAFTNVYREELMTNWLASCEEKNVKTIANYSLATVLTNSYQISVWNTHGLPRDQVSIENAIMVTQGDRWPLMIDPQEQANRWIRNMEQRNNLKICKMTDANFMRIMETCLRTGTPVLLEDVGEILDSSLQPILLKQIFTQAGQTLIRLADSEIEYDMNFKLYITTKMANPHYLPEICIRVTIVNFTVTPVGVEDQLLSEVVRLEKPDLEATRKDLIAKVNADRNQLRNIENKILNLLSTAEDNILDNEELVETLNDSKETSAVIVARLIESEATEDKISVARDKYRSVASRGSVLYFVLADLAHIDPMYQFSLKFFFQIFNSVIETSEKSTDLTRRLAILLDEISFAIYTNVSRGLFERHKLVFSLMLNTAIYLNAGIISRTELNFVLRGAPLIKVDRKPDYSTLTDQMWISINYLANTFDVFKNISSDAFKRITLTIGYYQEEINIIQTNKAKATYKWDENLNDMQKLMLLKSLKEGRLIFAFTAYISKNLGQRFIEPPMTSLQLLFADTSNQIPLVFILTTGSDPFGAFQKFASEMGFLERFDSISLGQGQSPIAESLLKRAITTGRWLFLQNCHLAISWMVNMEKLIMSLLTDVPLGSIHLDFRLYLSSMPNAAFPVSVLQNSVKVTSEPPRGLKANMKRALRDLEEDMFEDNGESWRKIVFGICFFHAIIQERKKFGPLGWNILYEFTDDDRECCLLNLKIFCEQGIIPWDALIYITGEITYGGRVTDYWDLRCLKTILDIFLSPKTLDPEYRYSPSEIYYCPIFDTLREYRDFVETFPIIETPEIFGMHENANISCQLKETQSIIHTILEVQPKELAMEEGRSNTDIAYEIAEDIMEKIDAEIDPDLCHPLHLRRDKTGKLPSLTTVLLQEVDRYNILLNKIHISMENLQRAIKGFVVMSEELENISTALVNNQVPTIWHNMNIYPSLKNLGSWIRNLELRIDFINIWFSDSKPISFWISGLSFPQGFLTGILQTYARNHNVPIDQLKLDFTVTNVLLDQEDIAIVHKQANEEVEGIYGGLKAPDDGVLVHGLFIDAGKWDFHFKILVDANIGEINPPLPVIHINPVFLLPEDDPRYVCPLYKTAIRAGTLSTTGHSTNFVLMILLPSARSQSYWILKGTALLIEIID